MVINHRRYFSLDEIESWERAQVRENSAQTAEAQPARSI
jgi:hypothetical protein